MPQWVPALTTPNTLTTAKGVWQKLTVTAKMTTAIDNAESWYILYIIKTLITAYLVDYV